MKARGRDAKVVGENLVREADVQEMTECSFGLTSLVVNNNNTIRKF